ncbi:MAG: DUF1614 domain-containing protein [Granulosicoccaceae bacterium]
MPRISPPHMLIFIGLLAVFITLIHLGILRIAFDKLGLSPGRAYLLLMISLFGSVINLPLFTIKTDRPVEIPVHPLFRGLLHRRTADFQGKTLIAVNVGGCLVPVTFSLYLLTINPLAVFDVIAGVTVVATMSYLLSRPIPGLGIGMPIFVAPITAALVALLLNPELSAPLAYISGTLGVVIGADLLKLHDIGKIGTPVAAIGGAGTFDGIFITGIVAVLLA